MEEEARRGVGLANDDSCAEPHTTTILRSPARKLYHLCIDVILDFLEIHGMEQCVASLRLEADVKDRDRTEPGARRVRSLAAVVGLVASPETDGVSVLGRLIRSSQEAAADRGEAALVEEEVTAFPLALEAGAAHASPFKPLPRKKLPPLLDASSISCPSPLSSPEVPRTPSISPQTTSAGQPLSTPPVSPASSTSPSSAGSLSAPSTPQAVRPRRRSKSWKKAERAEADEDIDGPHLPNLSSAGASSTVEAISESSEVLLPAQRIAHRRGIYQGPEGMEVGPLRRGAKLRSKERPAPLNLESQSTQDLPSAEDDALATRKPESASPERTGGDDACADQDRPYLLEPPPKPESASPDAVSEEDEDLNLNGDYSRRRCDQRQRHQLLV